MTFTTIVLAMRLVAVNQIQSLLYATKEEEPSWSHTVKKFVLVQRIYQSDHYKSHYTLYQESMKKNVG